MIRTLENISICRRQSNERRDRRERESGSMAKISRPLICVRSVRVLLIVSREFCRTDLDSRAPLNLERPFRRRSNRSSIQVCESARLSFVGIARRSRSRETYASSDDARYSRSLSRYARHCSHCWPIRKSPRTLARHSENRLPRGFPPSGLPSRFFLRRFSRCVASLVPPVASNRHFLLVVRSITRFGCSLHALPAALACPRPASSRSRS